MYKKARIITKFQIKKHQIINKNILTIALILLLIIPVYFALTSNTLIVRIASLIGVVTIVLLIFAPTLTKGSKNEKQKEGGTSNV